MAMKFFIGFLVIWMSMDVGGIVMASQKPETREARHLKSVARGNNEFALDLFNELRKEEGNIFFSPYSISAALAMTYAGAKDETASQMTSTLHFTLKDDALHGAFGNLTASLNARSETGGYELSVANALWGQKGSKFLEGFLELVESAYDAGLHNVDFKRDPEAARLEINSWVEERTREKIQNLLGRGVVNELTRLVLTNAIYFKGDWASQFDEDRTEDAPFYLSKNNSIDVPMMHQTTEFAYMESHDFQLIGMPYVNEALSMMVLLPREIDGIGELEESLSWEKLSDCLSEMKKLKVKVYMPRFKMTTGFKLNDPLVSLGMTDAFKPGLADFSGITGNRDFFISAVFHKAFVDVNEEGTEAAAATAVVMAVTGVSKPEPIPVFRADHPFLFLIHDNETGSILFMGRMADPEQ